LNLFVLVLYTKLKRCPNKPIFQPKLPRVPRPYVTTHGFFFFWPLLRKKNAQPKRLEKIMVIDILANHA
jgi:hypothetical protein